MGATIRIQAGSVTMRAQLGDTATAQAVVDALPIEEKARTWGDEIYFPVGLGEELDETASEVVEAGELGYWPSGDAFCIFFGPTPASRGDEIRAASAVNRIGRVLGDPAEFKNVADGDLVRIEADA